MLDLYGSSYVIEHCYAEMEKELEHKAFEYYVTDTLHLMGKNIATIVHGEHLKYSWREMCEGIINFENQKNGEEIAKDVMSKAGLSFGD